MDVFPSVRAARLAATGAAISARARVRGVWFNSPAGGGQVVLRDGGASGTVMLTLDFPAAVAGYYMLLPAAGIIFGTDVHATIPGSSTLTVFYD